MPPGPPTPLRQPLGPPPSGLAARVGRLRLPALLEGGPEFGEAGRYSHYLADPSLVFEATGSNWSITTGRDYETGHGDPLDALARLIDRLGLGDPSPSLDPFVGGLVGFLGYDLAPRIERLPRRHPRRSRLPDARFGLYETGLTLDHATGSLNAWSTPILDRADPSRHLAALLAAVEASDPADPARSTLGEVKAAGTREEHEGAVRRALEYIAAGDIFQVNLAQRFTTTGRVDPLDLYLRLRRVSPAPFSAFLAWDDLAIVSASPEWFYRVDSDRRIVTRPIKGTRRRGATGEEDRGMVEELLASAKDRAELTMIVDLERNDLGRVCEYGSIRVTDALTVESYAQVHHLVATVDGTLRRDAGPIDVVRAVFPGGSITGAPKIRAMEIIDELEPRPRGLYTGAIGYFGAGGRAAFNIAIRTITVEGEVASYQVGGGIVADSDPAAEYDETLHKGRGLRAVLEGAGG